MLFIILLKFTTKQTQTNELLVLLTHKYSNRLARITSAETMIKKKTCPKFTTPWNIRRGRSFNAKKRPSDERIYRFVIKKIVIKTESIFPWVSKFFDNVYIFAKEKLSYLEN